ncbi:hypothetical protein [Desulfuromonas sp.]|uniref:hypothetical protein n=1 Tax=Desulfuromonas sp. TaxID=892 RepID=UPI0025B9138A|nr:hypothetical protein [Desulfuromonas sp.]
MLKMFAKAKTVQPAHVAQCPNCRCALDGAHWQNCPRCHQELPKGSGCHGCGSCGKH